MLVLSLQENSVETAQLQLSGKRIDYLSGLNPTLIDITSHFMPEREGVETFIRDIYKQSYDATIKVTYPVLMSIRNGAGEILASAGFRPANQERLFLEQYTLTPIQDVLSERYNKVITRNEIMEIGNLASIGNGASLFLFAALSSFLDSRLVRYVTITGTDTLQNRLHKLGLSPQVLCDADHNRLIGVDKESWGSYYNNKPRVMSGSVQDSMQHLQKALGVVFEDMRPIYLPRLHYRMPA